MVLIITKIMIFNQHAPGGESSRWSCQLQSCPRTGFRISIISAHDILFPLMTIVLTIWFDSFLIFNLFRFSILLFLIIYSFHLGDMLSPGLVLIARGALLTWIWVFGVRRAFKEVSAHSISMFRIFLHFYYYSYFYLATIYS